AQNYQLIVQAYDCMMRWILVGQWIVDDHDCYQAVIATLSRGITIFDRDDPSTQVDTQTEKKKRRDTAFPPTKQLFMARSSKTQLNANSNDANGTNGSSGTGGNRSNPMCHKKEEIAVKTAAEYCMSQFVNQLGNFPPWRDRIGPSRMSTMWDDLGLAKNQRRNHKTPRHREPNEDRSVDHEEGERAHLSAKNTVRYFILDGRVIVSVIDFVKHGRKGAKKCDDATIVKGNRDLPSVIAIFRDTTGKYSWTTTSQYVNQNAHRRTSSRSSSAPLPSSTTPSRPHTPQSTPQVVTFIPPVSIVRTGTPPPIDEDIKSTANVATVRAINEDEIPSIDKILKEGTDSWHAWKLVKDLTEKQKVAEAAVLKQKDAELNADYKAVPTAFNGDVDQ
ncbi:hypothetical protein BC938DRAFT_477867, partial [Jimgerdemannia flammicorona]